MITDFERVLSTLRAGGVEFILIGGLAGVIHGAARSTNDVDIVYGRDSANLKRLVTVLAPLSPYPRGAPPGLPFQWDERTLRNGLNFTLTTTIGMLDLLAEIPGGGSYVELLPHSTELALAGVKCRCLDLPTLIRVKRAAGRPKDYEAIAELEAILEEQQGK